MDILILESGKDNSFLYIVFLF